MPNIIDANGLQVATRTELLTNYTTALQAIYGPDINLASDTPDGQMINLFIQSVLDLEDLLVQINNQFDPDQAVGVILDQRVAINGIQRQAGTYTITNITIVTTQALNLPGLDQTVLPVYTVADNAGNQWNLITSQTISGAGTYVFPFRAATPGANLTIPNTITVPVTIILGVQSINNPTTYTSLGLNEETDFQLKVRRQRSVSLASQGYLAGLLAALENINGVTSAFVQENNTGTTNINNVPGHSIWVIIGGTADSAAIATAIYQKRNAGCGLYGSVTYPIVQQDGTTFIVRWDYVTAQTLYIRFTATSLDGINQVNIDAIRSGLVTSFVPGVNAQVNINDLATAVQEIDNNCLVTAAGFSLSPTGPFTDTLTPSDPNMQFAVTEPNIIILPVLLTPTSSVVVHGNTQTMLGLGGFGAYTYTMLINNSGGSINPTSGLYVAGASYPVVDTIQVTDSQGHTATATVTVT